MQTGTQRLIWEQFEVLPAEKQREVADFIEFLSNRSGGTRNRPSRTKRRLADESFVGMWADREDMADSTEWVRRQRRCEWGDVT